MYICRLFDGPKPYAPYAPHPSGIQQYDPGRKPKTPVFLLYCREIYAKTHLGLILANTSTFPKKAYGQLLLHDLMRFSINIKWPDKVRNVPYVRIKINFAK